MVLRIKNLSKNFRTPIKKAGLLASIKSVIRPEYKTHVAVDNISFDIKKGESVAFIGPNGAGKSTTIKMLTGILYPSSGEISVLGFNPAKERKKLAYKIGTLFGQKTQLWYHLPAQETFDLFAKIYDLEDEVYKKRLNMLVKIFEIESLLTTPVRKLSLGQRMRCELVAALLHDPEVLFLDEPTIGLDLVAKKMLRKTIREFNKKGLTVLLTSHDLDDVEQVCERIIVINEGKIIYDDSVEKLKKKYVTKKIISLILEEMPKKIIKRKGVEIKKSSDSQLIYEIDISCINQKKFIQEVLERHVVLDITISDMSIEEIIEEIYG